MQRIGSDRSGTLAVTTSQRLLLLQSAIAADNDDIQVSGDAASSNSSSVSYAGRTLHSEQELMSIERPGICAYTDAEIHESVAGLYLTGWVKGFCPPQEVADPLQKVLQNLFGGIDSNPPKNPPIPLSC